MTSFQISSWRQSNAVLLCEANFILLWLFFDVDNHDDNQTPLYFVKLILKILRLFFDVESFIIVTKIIFLHQRKVLPREFSFGSLDRLVFSILQPIVFLI